MLFKVRPGRACKGAPKLQGRGPNRKRALPGPLDQGVFHACALTGRTCLRSGCLLPSYVTDLTHLLSAVATRATLAPG